MLFRMSLIIFSLFFMTGCMNGPKRPHSLVYGINGAKHTDATKCPGQTACGFYVDDDFDSNGDRYANAEPKLKDLPNGLADLNGAICFLPVKNPATNPFKDEGVKGMKVWLGRSREWGKDHCK